MSVCLLCLYLVEWHQITYCENRLDGFDLCEVTVDVMLFDQRHANIVSSSTGVEVVCVSVALRFDCFEVSSCDVV